MIRSIILSFLFLFSANCISAQSDKDFIRHTIHNYFNGTAFNHIEQIEAAFYSEAVLYLENREGQLVQFSASQYIDLFRKNKAGQFIGRYNKILSIDQEGNLAQVKAEILMPGRNRRYIDVFILRRMEPQLWQIVSKAANSKPIE